MAGAGWALAQVSINQDVIADARHAPRVGACFDRSDTIGIVRRHAGRATHRPAPAGREPPDAAGRVSLQ